MAHSDRFVWLLLAALILCARPVAAQVGAGSLVLAATVPDGSAATGAVIRIDARDGSHTRDTTVDAAAPARVTLPPGQYRLTVELATFRTAEREISIGPGEILRLIAHLELDTSAGPSAIVEDDRSDIAYQTSFPVERLRALPTSGTVWSLIDIAHPFLISDRIDNGGLWSAEPARIGGYGSSFTQTSYLLDGLDVTDPAGLGMPMAYPDLHALEAVAVNAAAMPADVAGPGPTIVLVPRRSGRVWSGQAQLAGTPRAWQQDVSEDSAPPIARFDSFVDSSLVLGGPIAGPKLGFFGTARVTNVRRLERASPVALRNDVLALFTRTELTRDAGDRIRFVGSAQDVTRPYAARALFADRALEEHVDGTTAQVTWDRPGDRHLFSLAGNLQGIHIDPDIAITARGGTIERLTDGPPLSLADTGFRSHYRWALGSTYIPSRQRWGGRDHDLQLGAGISRIVADVVGEASPPFVELVNGIPARLWSVGRNASSRRSAIGVNAFVSDRLSVLPGLTLTAGVRLEHDNGSAQEASNTISWMHLSPRLSVRWRPARDRGPVITSGYSWYRHRLLLDYFNVGDPRGVGGYVYRWDDLDGNRQFGAGDNTELVGPVGPCCTGSVVNTIDPDLRRPSTREFLIGVEHTFGPWRWSVTGLDRREHDLVTLVNTGVTVSDYMVSFVQDPGVDIAGASGIGPLPIYNRNPDSFGRDRYLLTNADTPSRYQGVEIGIERDVRDRWSLHFGGTAYRSEGTGVSRGYLPNENDQGLLGEAFTTPNAGTFARGRLFFDRAYVIKLSGAYRTPGDVHIALASRYQDGQPFARLVIADGLNQGADIVQAYPRGGQRFTYTLTLDAKINKEVRLGRARLGVALEIFNLLNMQNEVEEDIVTGPAFRTITAVQPPRAFRAGIRVGF